uniref:Uncharacterized protein n=1 Tax=Leersia perrieri TaxID=77586 RepID=A0A0D9WTA9_9ORYZ
MGGKGKGKQRREAEAALAAAVRREEQRRREEAAAVRGEAVAALRTDREGRYEEAIALADDLAAKHPESALVLHLAADLHHRAFLRAAVDGSVGEDSTAHLDQSRRLYEQAARLAPNCYQIAIGLAMTGLHNAKDLMPDREIKRAVEIASPTDPFETNVAFDLEPDGGGRNAMERIARARESAVNHYNSIMSQMLTDVIPRAVVDVLDIANREGTATARKRAKELVDRYDYSGRVFLTHGHISLQLVRDLDAKLDKKPFLHRILEPFNKVVHKFINSIEFSMFRAKICFLLRIYSSAEAECDRGISIENPIDPRLEDLPPGSIPGEKLEDRASYLRSELERMLQKLVLEARDYWSSLSVEKQHSFRVVGLQSLNQHYVDFYAEDHPARKTVSDALNFVKKNRSWRFWVCPYCVGKKIPGIGALLQHMHSKHPDGDFWPKLLSIVEPKLVPDTDTSQGDYFLKSATIYEDPEETYVFHFKSMDTIFRYLYLRAPTKIEQDPLSKMRGEKCSKGVLILEEIKLKLKDVPTDTSSPESNEACAEIRELWSSFLEISLLDYRVVISPFAMSFISDELFNCMTEDQEASKRSIDVAAIDAVFPSISVFPDVDEIFPKVEDAPDNNDTPVTHGQSAEETARIANYQSVGAFNKENTDKDLFVLRVIIQSLWNLRCFRDEFLRAPPAKILHINDNCISELLYGIFSAWEKKEQNEVDVLLTSLNAILCKFSDDSMFQKVNLANQFQLQDRKFFASKIMATILQALHMSETPLHFDFNSEIEECVVSPVSCGDCICRTHNLFGIMFHAQMSCKCGKCFDEKEHTTLFYRLDGGSPQTAKIESFAELPVLYDEQSCSQDNCKHCGSLKNVDFSPSITPHIFTIVLEWFGEYENKIQLSEVLVGIAHPLDIKLLCKGVISANYSLTSMEIQKEEINNELYGVWLICIVLGVTCHCVLCLVLYLNYHKYMDYMNKVSYADGRYICFVRDQDKWLICDAETVEAEDSWEQSLERFRDCMLQPEVLFFEAVK